MTESNSLGLPKIEVERTVPLAILLDVDGVVTNPTEKKITEPEILDHLVNQLRIGNPIALNTGRSNEWMIDRVIKPLSEKIENKSMLSRFFAVGEKGLTWASFDKEGNIVEGVFNRNGEQVVGFDLSTFLEPETVAHFKTLEAETKKLIDSKYSHSTFFDSSKKAMISTEMHDKYPDHPRYTREQVEFTQELKDLIKKAGLEGKFKVDPTTIATDIQLPHAGKHLGTQRVINWLKSRRINPSYFIAVGDSSSDLEMADELKAQRKSFEFHYVNPSKPLTPEQTHDANNAPKYKIVNSKNAYGKGLVETFQSLSNS